jgi:hypothetical protein
VHENGRGILGYSRGPPGKDCNCVPFPSSLDFNKKIQDLRNGFLLHNDTKMMLLVKENLSFPAFDSKKSKPLARFKGIAG